MEKTPNIIMEDARIIFKNFAGLQTQFNREGDRNFCVIIETDLANKLIEDGWNVKWLEPRDEEEEPQAYLKVAISFGILPPVIMQVTNRGQVRLNEQTIENLDWAEITHIDLSIRPYHWEVNGSTGIKAYLKTMYVTIEEDEFAHKYYDSPNID